MSAVPARTPPDYPESDSSIEIEKKADIAKDDKAEEVNDVGRMLDKVKHRLDRLGDDHPDYDRRHGLPSDDRVFERILQAD